MLSLRTCFATALCIMVPSAICFGQTPAKFSTVTSPGGSSAPYQFYTPDVNGDGTPDIVQVTSAAPYGYMVSIAKGDGTFKAPVTYPFPSELTVGSNSQYALGFADMNGDGKVDMIVTPAETGTTNQVAVFLGNGNGTFQQPKVSAISLPSGLGFNTSPIVTADFNHDGRIDVVTGADVVQGGADGILVLLAGDGQGGLSYKSTIFHVPSGQLLSTQIVAGDFDADNNADVALTTYQFCSVENCNTSAYVLYGNGAFGFEQKTAYSTPGTLTLSSGDLNGDGTTDLFGYEAYTTNQLVLLYGQAGKTFKNYFYSNVPGSFQGNGVTTLAMADFNGDGRMDLVGSNFGASQLVFFLAGGSPGDFTTQSYTLPSGGFSYAAAGNFTANNKPAVVLVSNFNTGGNGPSTIIAAVNQTAGYYGGCAYPKAGQGISLCTPSGSSADNPVSFNAAANSFGQIRKFELYVDGKKISEQHHASGHNAYFDLSTSLGTGSHYATLNVTTIDNKAMDYNTTFTVGASSISTK